MHLSIGMIEPKSGEVDVLARLISRVPELNLYNFTQTQWAGLYRHFLDAELPNVKRPTVLKALKKAGFGKVIPREFYKYEIVTNLEGPNPLFFIVDTMRCGSVIGLRTADTDTNTQVSLGRVWFGEATYGEGKSNALLRIELHGGLEDIWLESGRRLQRKCLNEFVKLTDGEGITITDVHSRFPALARDIETLPETALKHQL